MAKKIENLPINLTDGELRLPSEEHQRQINGSRPNLPLNSQQSGQNAVTTPAPKGLHLNHAAGFSGQNTPTQHFLFYPHIAQQMVGRRMPMSPRPVYYRQQQNVALPTQPRGSVYNRQRQNAALSTQPRVASRPELPRPQQSSSGNSGTGVFIPHDGACSAGANTDPETQPPIEIGTSTAEDNHNHQPPPPEVALPKDWTY